MQRPDYVINNVFRPDNLLTCNFAYKIEVFSVEVVVGDFKYTMVLVEQILKNSTFKVNVVKRDFTVSDDMNHPLNFWIFRLS